MIGESKFTAKSCARDSSSSIFFDSLKGDIIITTKRKVEVFSAGCPACVETIELVKRVACPSCEISSEQQESFRHHTVPKLTRNIKALTTSRVTNSLD